MLHKVYIGIGSNLGDREENIRTAIWMLKTHPMISVAKSSNIYEFKAFIKEGDAKQPDYLNGAVELETTLNPEALFSALLDIEKDFGRPHPRKSGEPRTLDLDILFYDDIILDTENLTIPHPGLSKRMFVLRPLCDICPSLVHPSSGKSVLEMREILDKDLR